LGPARPQGRVGPTVPIHPYGLKPPNGIEQFFKWKVLNNGEWRDGIQNVKGQGFTHAFHRRLE